MFLKRKDLIPFCEILFLNFVQNHVSYALSHIHLAAARRPASELVLEKKTHHPHPASTHPHSYPIHLNEQYFSDLQQYPKCITVKVIHRPSLPLFSKIKNVSKNYSTRREAPKMMLLKILSFGTIFSENFQLYTVQRPKNMQKT